MRTVFYFACLQLLHFRREVVAGQWHRVPLAADLELHHRQRIREERSLGAGKIEFPHAEESLVIKRRYSLTVGGEAPEPLADRIGIVLAPDLAIQEPEIGALDRG